MSIVNNARRETRRAIREGLIKQPKRCSSCRDSCIVDAHHVNYFEPLNVKWMCRHCHLKWHTKHGPAIGADLSFLALRIEDRGFDWHFPQKHVAELGRQIAQSGRYMGPDGPIEASLKLRRMFAKKLGYKRVIVFERAR